MCETCLHTNSVHTLAKARQYDPTRTTTLRNVMVRESNRRFDLIARTIMESVYKEDVFGIEVLQQTPGNSAFRNLSTDRQIREFLRWLEELIRLELIEVQDIPLGVSQRNWMFKYIKTAYERGVERAREELRKAGYNVPTIVASGGITTVMQTPIHLDTVALMYTRAFNDLQGITGAMQQQIARILADGLLTGANPRVLARRMVAAINGAGIGELGITDALGRFIPARRRAEILARTEIIRAHHYANIMEYKTWGVFGVSVTAEFRSAQDERVCTECEALDGQVFTLDEILPMIPVHPQCRCMALPIVKPINQ